MINEELEKNPNEGDSFWEFVRFALIAVLIVIPIRVFIAQPFVVSGSSMVPTFENGEYLIVDELSYRLGEPERGDVVIFRYPNDRKKFFIKRIIGLPNEKVEIKGSTITIKNENDEQGFTLDQSYIENKSSDNINITLSNDEYFVMGDNRSHSSDSRIWGPVNRDLIIGKAFLRLLPVTKIDVWPGKITEIE